MEEIINMEDMGLVYEVTDDLGIDREELRVELTKEDPGSFRRGADGMFEIILPLTTPLKEWLPVLRGGLEDLV